MAACVAGVEIQAVVRVVAQYVMPDRRTKPHPDAESCVRVTYLAVLNNGPNGRSAVEVDRGGAVSRNETFRLRWDALAAVVVPGFGERNVVTNRSDI